jgi:hypothetical protein
MSSSAGAGAGGEGGAGCPGCESGFCLDDGTCVDCLPSNDHCPQGEYCSDANECASGCKADGSSCVSGVCLADHNCQNCLNDDECGAGNVCGNGQCAPACTVAQEGSPAGCAESLSCCSRHCVDVATNRNHCGACGAACGDTEFCGLDADGAGGAGGAGAGPGPAVSCKATVLANVCAIDQIVLIHDTSTNASDGDRAPAEAIGAALVDLCPSSPSLQAADQADADVLNFVTGRPVSGGGELLVIAGGPFFQAVERYLEEKRISPLYFESEGASNGYRKSSNDAVVLSQPVAGDHESEDYFIVQFSNDPASGSLILNAQGLWLSGTVAASFFVTNQILPNLASYDDAWYAYKWTDLDDDKAPSLDEITLVEQGS